MQQHNDVCQLSQAEKRILAEAELLSQRKRLHELKVEYREAMQRIHRAKRIILGGL